jgi:acyl carrier protein
LRNFPKVPLDFPITELEFDSGIAPFDLNLDVTETPEGLSCRLQYCTDLFRRETGDKLLRHYEFLLERILADPSRPLSLIPLPPEEERQGTAGFGPFPESAPISLFEQQAAAHPHQPAVPFRDVIDGPNVSDEYFEPRTSGDTDPKPPRRHTPPRTETEVRLCAIWRGLLGGEPNGIEENFFEAGGHSLMAMRLASRMEREFGKAVPLRAIFENPTLEKLARFLEPSA